MWPFKWIIHPIRSYKERVGRKLGERFGRWLVADEVRMRQALSVLYAVLNIGGLLEGYRTVIIAAFGAVYKIAQAFGYEIPVDPDQLDKLLLFLIGWFGFLKTTPPRQNGK